MIYDSTKKKDRVEPVLDKLLELNAKILLFETGREPFDESIKPYLETPEFNNNSHMMMLPLPMGFMNRRGGDMIYN